MLLKCGGGLISTVWCTGGSDTFKGQGLEEGLCAFKGVSALSLSLLFLIREMGNFALHVSILPHDRPRAIEEWRRGLLSSLLAPRSPKVSLLVSQGLGFSLC